MADAEEKKQKESEEKTGDGKSKIGMLTWIILVVIILLFAGSGYILGNIIAGTNETLDANDPAELKLENIVADDETAEGEYVPYFHPLNPVVANLDEPAVTRYVRVSIMLEVDLAWYKEKGGDELFVNKEPLLTNWLTIYMASLTLDDTRGDKNLRRIQLQVLDAFNEFLFPDEKPKIKSILFKEFAVQ
jgi:flagellar basal body-associated protein FliL